MAQVMKTYFASVISEIEQSDIYLTIKARLFEAPKPNLNGVRVTSAFIDEIVSNEDKYIGLPLCADVKNLANGNYEHLGHLYDSRTGEFHSTQIGSFYKYEKETFTENSEECSYLIGYARVMKRNKAICKALAELFAQGKLKFSFEISCSEYRKLQDDTIEIDACEGNFLEGAAVVSLPACEDAIALELVAEAEKIAFELINDKKGDCDMADVNVNVNTEAIAEETAEVVVTQTHSEHDCIRTFDTETGTEIIQCDESFVEVREIAETTSDGAIDNEVTAESSKKQDEQVIDPADIEDSEEVDDTTETASCKKKASDEEVSEEESAECGKKKTCSEEETSTCKKKAEDTTEDPEESEPEEEDASCKKKVAELLEEIENLKHEIAELKSQREVDSKRINEIAEKRNDSSNPFMASISIDDSHKKFSLLEPVEKRSHYSLLD